jgi:folate-binding protein YgfZ
VRLNGDGGGISQAARAVAAVDRHADLAESPGHPKAGGMIAQLEDRAVIGVAGTDARAFLQGLLTQDVEALTPGQSAYAGLLSPQGKALFDMILFGDGDAVMIDIAAGREADLMRRLQMYRLRKAVTIAPAPLAVFAAWGDDAGGRPTDPRTAALGARWLATPGSADAGADAWHAHRLAVGVPDSADIGSDELLWLETGADLLNGVSFTKGCYVGQENTARMHHRDKVRRRLLPVTLSADPGDERAILDAQGRSAGSLRGWRGHDGIAHLRVEAAAGPLTLGGAPLVVSRPAWAEPALAGSVTG